MCQANSIVRLTSAYLKTCKKGLLFGAPALPETMDLHAGESHLYAGLLESVPCEAGLCHYAPSFGFLVRIYYGHATCTDMEELFIVLCILLMHNSYDMPHSF